MEYAPTPTFVSPLLPSSHAYDVGHSNACAGYKRQLTKLVGYSNQTLLLPTEISLTLESTSILMSPSKVQGQTKANTGSLKERIGNLIGSKRMAAKGRDKHARGQAEVSAAKSQGYAEGTADRASGKKDAVLGGLTGNKTRQAHGNAVHDKGQAKQHWNH